MSEVLDAVSPLLRQRSQNASVLIGPTVRSLSGETDDAFCEAPRWAPGTRLHHLFEARCDRLEREARPSDLAIVAGDTEITFAELDRRANRMARLLAARGVVAGDKVGLLLDRSAAAYATLLAVLKLEAAYVPLDVKFPSDRIAFIAEDAGIKLFITTADAAALAAAADLPLIDLHDADAASQFFDDTRIAAPLANSDDRLAYIIYTSGSTGRPKGVAVNHSSICNFVEIAAELYGYVPGDRVYQGLALAFDFSVEELWVPLVAGATLVPAPVDHQMIGDELGDFIARHNITALCCVPTLLATIHRDLPNLRLLLVSGEACPPDIVARWHRPGRRMLNAYGPTEATVTATWTEVAPDKPVTIGVPLPTYSVAIIEPASASLAAPGEPGEIAIAGIGLAQGYVNRPDLTEKVFIPDFLGLPGNPSSRLYRTGDLGRITEDGEIEYLGRIDTQVKIRGYRIELAEIENVLLEVDGVAQAVVTTYESEPGLTELAAYYTCFDADARPSRTELTATLRTRLPGYMIPAYLEELEEIPLLASHKADRSALPPPSNARVVGRSTNFVAPRTVLEDDIAACLADTLQIDAISIDDHFYDELGAHSLLMGQFLARLNAKRPDLRASIADVYICPTIRTLAEDLEARRRANAAKPSASAEKATAPSLHVASDWAIWTCGAVQALFYFALNVFYLGLAVAGATWVSGGTDFTGMFGRAGAFAALALAATLALPIAAKWLIIGRWRAGTIPLWSSGFLRFWVVQQLTDFTLWRAFKGTALFNFYLRFLGARIGDGVVILADKIPLATDLVSIGAHTVLRQKTQLTAYKAEHGRLVFGPVAIGDHVTVGARSHLDIDTQIDDRGQLGHSSALLAGGRIAAGERFHGSPAEPTQIDFEFPENTPTPRWRRAAYAGVRLLSVYLLAALFLLMSGGAFSVLLGEAMPNPALDVGTGLTFGAIAAVLAGSVVTFAALYLGLLAVHLTVPRLLRAFIEPGRIYPLYGFHHFIAVGLGATGYSVLLQSLFGDSSAIVHYLRLLGVKQPDVKQTGSNFGTALAYESPTDLTFGSGTMISDGLTIINIETGSSAFRLVPAEIGVNSFVGNSIILPPGARIGDNCLLATKVMVPVNGPVRENVGLLGSPAFEIPRETVNEKRFSPVPTTPAARARLAAKNRFNFRTALWHLASQWALMAGLMLIGYLAFQSLSVVAAILLVSLLAPLYVLAHGVAVERLSVAGITMKPTNCTIHERHFWWVERHWKFGETPVKYALIGTPWRAVLLRLLGLKVGRGLFDDGMTVPEKALVSIGDNCTINASTSIQGHSLEDGLFKADRINIGDRCTIAPGGFVHYGVTMSDGSVLNADAFLMKGARTEPNSTWTGNPAHPV